MKKILCGICVMAFLFASFDVNAQVVGPDSGRTFSLSPDVIPGDCDSTQMAVVNFRINGSALLRDYMDNARALDMLDQTFNQPDFLDNLQRLVITAGSSPEGRIAYNEELAGKRAQAVKSYILWRFPFLNRDMISTTSIGEDWAGLRQLVADDANMPNRAAVLEVIDSNRGSDAKIAKLKTIGGGAYRYMATHMFPRLRRAVSVGLYYKVKESEPAIVEEPEPIVEPQPVVEPEPEPAIEPEPEPVVEIPARIVEKYPLFAIKTNLLFDAATALNVEVEVPIGKRWSVAAEWIFPWWLWKSKQIALETGTATVEGRYWLGNREEKPLLTGWFAGLYAGAGYYDLEWKNRGYQGELWHFGVGAGYAHTISKNGNWRMEYALGLGYMTTDYRKYRPEMGLDDKWHLIRQRNGTRTWVGPTRAKVSLVWMFNATKTRKGGVR